MVRLSHYLLLIGAIGFTLAGGILHGTLSHGWWARQDISASTHRLGDFPTSFGDWQVHKTYPISQTVQDTLRCTGYLHREYIHNVTGELVSVAVMLGPAGPISVHTPEVCYSSREYRQRGNRRAVTIRDDQGNKSDFWNVAFDSTGLEKTVLTTYYAWCFDGQWAADENPRIHYAGRPYLFKVQLAALLPHGADLKNDDPCQRFLTEFVPAMNQHVFTQLRKTDISQNRHATP